MALEEMPTSGIASDEFRDGAATGAHDVAHRAKQMMEWGVKVDSFVLEQLAENIRYEMGGKVR